MGAIGRLILVVLIALGAFYFVKKWHSVTPWGTETGKIGGASRDLPARDKRSVPQKVGSQLHEIVTNPTRFENKRATVNGRVRGASKYASNRNIYMLTDGNDRILVIDDKQPPQEYWPRAVSGTVKVIGPPIGGLQYAYIVDVKQGVKVNPPTWSEVSHFFTDKYQDVKQGAKEIHAP
ncbi:MAG: hypothetical protein JO316_05730 [Abitibacteriaceae bacterium]|nr:hypothetical protein [Abditibacteriaceae bacterium]